MEQDASREPWDKRPAPGRSNDDPMCINCHCPSAFSYGRPALLGGLICDQFQPDVPHPSYNGRTPHQ